MNSVHEPGPNGDSKISPSQKPVRKTKLDARAPSRPNKHAQMRTGEPRRAHAQARARPAVSWAGLPVSWLRPPAVSQPKPPCRSAPRAPLLALPHGPQLAVPRAPSPAPLRALPLACRRPPWQYRERTGCLIVGTNRSCRRRSCHIAALRARVSRPSAQRPRALRSPARPT